MIILEIIFFAFLFTFAYACLRAAPWLPTFSKDVERFLGITGIKKGEKFYDLGCGDGRLTFAAAEAGSEAHGFEVSLLPYLLAQIRLLFRKRNKNRPKFHFKDFWTADLRDADLIYIFLTPKANQKIKVKLEQELKKGSRVVTYTWPIEGWEPEKIDREPGRADIYLYRR